MVSYNKMKKFYLFLFVLSCLPFMAVADDYNRLDQEELHGPVKIVFEERSIGVQGQQIGAKQSVQMGDVFYYDHLGRERRNQQFIGGKCMNDERINPQKKDSAFVHLMWDEDGKLGDYVTKDHYDSLGRKDVITYYHKNELWYRDSLVYNKWNKVERTYYSFKEKPYGLNQEYAFDSLGNVVSMRDYWGDGTLQSGYDVERKDGVAVLHHFGSSFKDSPIEHWEETIYFNKDGHVVQVTRHGDEYTYSDFDQFGNWTRGECSGKSGSFPAKTTCTRRIEYWGQPDDAIAKARNKLIHLAGGKTWEEQLTEVDTTFVKPLIVCDGVVDAEPPKDVKEIESVTAMNPGEAMKLYGEKGRYGAAIIITKKYAAAQDSLGLSADTKPLDDAEIINNQSFIQKVSQPKVWLPILVSLILLIIVSTIMLVRDKK